MQVEPVPSGSIYMWSYRQGLHGVSLHEVEDAVSNAGKTMRQKDIQNWENGFWKRNLSESNGSLGFFINGSVRCSKFEDMSYHEYQDHPFMDMNEPENRWVPCNQDNKPLIKWSKGCLDIQHAKATRNCKYLAENMLGQKRIVIDCDGDHDEDLDMETIDFLWRFSSMTHTLSKPKMIWEYGKYPILPEYNRPASFHLTFYTDKVIPTMHFPNARIDIIGNERNSLRYMKNKESNLLDPIPMTEEIWNELKEFILRKERHG